MTTVDELELAIKENPEDTEAWQVYADYLQSINDPFGEIIALGIALQEQPNNDQFKSQFAKLFSKRTAIGKAAKYDNKANDGILLKTKWKYGYLIKASLSTEETQIGPLATILKEIFNAPGSKFVQELEIILPDEYDKSRIIYEDCITALQNIGPHHGIKAFKIADAKFSSDGYLLSRYTYANPDIFPNLKNLTLQGNCIRLESLSHPKLESLVIQSLSYKNESLLYSLNLPNLQYLELWTTSFPRRSEGSYQILNKCNLPALKHLKLNRTICGNHIILEVLHSSLLPQLEILDLSNSNITDLGAETFLEHHNSFQHLSQIIINYNYTSAKMRRKLSKIYGECIIMDKQRDASRYKVNKT